MSSWLAMLQDAAEMFVFLAVELSLLFIVISAGVSLIRQKVPDHKIQQMMGARKGRGYLLAALLGAVTPFCSCSTIPMLRGLLSACVFRSIRSRIGIEVRSAIRIHSINRELNFFYRFLTRFFAAFHYRGIFPQ